jgi:hypothetical protein
MSYLAGPLTRTQISQLTAAKPAPKPPVTAATSRPVAPTGMTEKFIAGRATLEPFVVGRVKAHYALAKANIDGASFRGAVGVSRIQGLDQARNRDKALFDEK